MKIIKTGFFVLVLTSLSCSLIPIEEQGLPLPEGVTLADVESRIWNYTVTNAEHLSFDGQLPGLQVTDGQIRQEFTNEGTLRLVANVTFEHAGGPASFEFRLLCNNHCDVGEEVVAGFGGVQLGERFFEDGEGGVSSGIVVRGLPNDFNSWPQDDVEVRVTIRDEDLSELSFAFHDLRAAGETRVAQGLIRYLQ